MHLVGFGCFGKRLVVVCVVKKEDGWISGRDRRLLDTGRDEKIVGYWKEKENSDFDHLFIHLELRGDRN
jgi:hypothetical protein